MMYARQSRKYQSMHPSRDDVGLETYLPTRILNSRRRTLQPDDIPQTDPRNPQIHPLGPEKCREQLTKIRELRAFQSPLIEHNIDVYHRYDGLQRRFIAVVLFRNWESILVEKKSTKLTESLGSMCMCTSLWRALPICPATVRIPRDEHVVAAPSSCSIVDRLRCKMGYSMLVG